MKPSYIFIICIVFLITITNCKKDDIKEQPNLMVDTTTVDFGIIEKIGEIKTKTFTISISKLDDEVVSWQAITSKSWLHLNKSSGEIYSKMDTITITLNSSLLNFGDNVAEITITPSINNEIGVPMKIKVTANINTVLIENSLEYLYSSFMISNSEKEGKYYIPNADPYYSTTARSLWSLQQLPTDETMCAWSDAGIDDLNTMSWTTSNPFLTVLYQRLCVNISLAKNVINFTKNANDIKIKRYNAEARFLRAYAYYLFIDLFGNPPFATENDTTEVFNSKQIDLDFNTGRKKLFNYLVSELKSMEQNMYEAGNSYPYADKACAWMLLARLYLNAEVYTGVSKWDSCIIYTNKIIDCGKYSLAKNYRQNFSADNGGSDGNREMIFALAQDGQANQGYVGTTFIIQSCSDTKYLDSRIFHGLSTNANWNGNVARKQFLNIMIDTLKVFNNQPIPWNTVSFFTESKDKRVFLRAKRSPEIPNLAATGDYGIGVYKFTAKLSDGTFPSTFSTTFSNTDFPIFRYADALLMKAEASFRLGDPSTAAFYINMIRERAFGDNSEDVFSSDITDQLILNERAREFYYEAQRRTDLIRFGQFTGGTYLWAWKGGVLNGTSTSQHLNVYPIPITEISKNPFMVQNPGY